MVTAKYTGRSHLLLLRISITMNWFLSTYCLGVPPPSVDRPFDGVHQAVALFGKHQPGRHGKGTVHWHTEAVGWKVGVFASTTIIDHVAIIQLPGASAVSMST